MPIIGSGIGQKVVLGIEFNIHNWRIHSVEHLDSCLILFVPNGEIAISSLEDKLRTYPCYKSAIFTIEVYTINGVNISALSI